MYFRQNFYLMIVFTSSALLLPLIHPVRHYAVLGLTQQELDSQGKTTQQQQQAVTSAIWSSSEDSWNYWWSYVSVSGPAYWGLVNSDWYICDKGRRQSPIDIETKSLVYDPHLTPLRTDNNLISGFLHNDGHAIVFSTQQQQQGPAFKQDSNASRDFALMADQPSTLNTPAQTLLNLNPQESMGNSVLSELSSISRDLGLNGLKADQSKLDGLQFEKLDSFSNSAGTMQQRPGDLEGADESSAAENSINSSSADEFTPLAASTDNGVTFTQAGLAYPYRFEALYLRFGAAVADGEPKGKLVGSEHLINSQAFAAELQIVAYNNALYKSYSDASTKAHGLLAISVLIDVLPAENSTAANKLSSKTSTSNLNMHLELLLSHLKEVQYRGNFIPIHNFNLSALLPETDYFITYDGSITKPGCHESVTWIVINKPLYITEANLNTLRTISADENSGLPTGKFIAGNIRPVQPVNGRPIRTNIRPISDSSKSPETCQRLWTRYDYRYSRTAINQS